MPHLKALDDYRRKLDLLPMPDIPFLPRSQEVRHFFTDGSARDSNCPLTRLCSWAVTWAQPNDSKNQVIVKATLSGRKQTVFRAELQAVLVALTLSENIWVYCDNEAVVKNTNTILRLGYQPHRWHTHPDRDLLKTVGTVLHGRHIHDVRIIWTKAHRDVTQAVNFQDLWQRHHNAKADRAAGSVMVPNSVAAARGVLQSRIFADMSIREQCAGFLRAVMDEFPQDDPSNN